ncbi:hypothetical protein J4406_00965 [Candidatus Woesearchaeota archaeon]|nr:hypothetical protein [Candidatus Woesearchaeota archaeon]
MALKNIEGIVLECRLSRRPFFWYDIHYVVLKNGERFCYLNRCQDPVIKPSEEVKASIIPFLKRRSCYGNVYPLALLDRKLYK